MRKDRSETNETGVATGLITAVVLVAIFGLGIMFGGAVALRKGGELGEDAVALFMFLTFLIVGAVEIFLLRQLSRLLGSGSRTEHADQPQPVYQLAPVASANELRAAPLRTLPEPIPSVTENTTRTLEQSFKDSSR